MQSIKNYFQSFKPFKLSNINIIPCLYVLLLFTNPKESFFLASQQD